MVRGLFPASGGTLHEAVQRLSRKGRGGEDVVDPPADIAFEGVLDPVVEEGVFPELRPKMTQDRQAFP